MAVMETDRLVKHKSTLMRIPGDFAEIGVFRANTFKRLAPMAKQQGKVERNHRQHRWGRVTKRVADNHCGLR